MNAEIERLADMANETAEQKKAFDNAIAEERTAKAVLLAHLVQAMDPALPAVCSYVIPIAKLKGRDLPNNRALLVCEGKGGTGLYLLESGSFMVVSPVSPHPGDWARDFRLVKMTEVAEERWDLGEIFASCADALAAQLDGKMLVRTEEIQQRAFKLHAIEVLLRGVA